MACAVRPSAVVGAARGVDPSRPVRFGGPAARSQPCQIPRERVGVPKVSARRAKSRRLLCCLLCARCRSFSVWLKLRDVLASCWTVLRSTPRAALIEPTMPLAATRKSASTT